VEGVTVAASASLPLAVAPRVSLFSRLGLLWWRTFHRKAMWPIRGKYICPACLRETPVRWDVRGGLHG
jgi:hypothetical protein